MTNTNKIALLWMFSLFLVLFNSCQQAVKKQTSGEVPIETPQSVTPDTSAQSPAVDTLISLEMEQEDLEDPAGFKIREGKHSITLQWISWDNPGEAEIKYTGNGRYRISGEQTNPNNDDRLRIDGTLIPVTSSELKFEGTILTQSEGINDGNPCVKEGEQTFLSTKNRKYWRLQEMDNCEGGMVVDYVDIYF